jgi:hypothetical protein
VRACTRFRFRFVHDSSRSRYETDAEEGQIVKNRLAMAAIAAALCSLAAPAPAADAKDPGAVQEILSVLRERGILDEAEYERIAAKNRSYEEREAKFLPKLQFYGDFRGRLESFWFDRDETNVNNPNRHRARYRFRLGASTQINEYIGLNFRLATQDGHRSQNQTLGDAYDFAPDGIFIDWAYMDLAPFKKLPSPLEGGTAVVRFGKMPNPFLWKIGKDFLLWDNDITPEGAALMLTGAPTENSSVFLNGGYFILREQSFREQAAPIADESKDPHVLGLQVGGEVRPLDTVAVGARGTWYSFRSLDAAFIANEATFGNVADGLVGSRNGGRAADVLEAAGYVRYTGFADWPLTVFADYASNTDGEASRLFADARSNRRAWGAGVEVGDKKKWLLAGVGYWLIEANVFPAQLTDSDITDGFTNRSGWGVWAAREILPNTELSVELLLRSNEDEDNTAFFRSVPDAERIRLRTDLTVKF